MKKKDLLKKLQSSIIAAKSHLDAVEILAKELAEKEGIDINISSSTPAIEIITSHDDSVSKIVEGVFNGEKMVTQKGEEYPVPANYASKSKLVEGDTLKLTIKPTGEFLYKQIEQVPREIIQGRLILDGNQYKVLADGRTYKVLYASVSFYRGNVGDSSTILIPTQTECEWGAIDNIIPTKKKILV